MPWWVEAAVQSESPTGEPLMAVPQQILVLQRDAAQPAEAKLSRPQRELVQAQVLQAAVQELVQLVDRQRELRWVAPLGDASRPVARRRLYWPVAHLLAGL